MSMTQDDLRMSPYQVAAETFVIPWVLQAPPVGLFCMNSLVIRGQEPVIVDTGSPANRDEWLANVSSVVDPGDVRWIFLSHDDRDHSGNLLAALDACPNATLVTNWFSVGRMAEEWMTPLDRCRFVNEGDRLDIGDRTLTAVRPPVFDNPTTRGIFDDKTGVFWSVDTFALPCPRRSRTSRTFPTMSSRKASCSALASWPRGIRGWTKPSTAHTSTRYRPCRSK